MPNGFAKVISGSVGPNHRVPTISGNHEKLENHKKSSMHGKILEFEKSESWKTHEIL